MTQAHPIPDERTIGRVVEVDKSRPPSERITAAEAAVAAREHANDNDAERVALHDHDGTHDR
jgi:hypothetical protein